MSTSSEFKFLNVINGNVSLKGVMLSNVKNIEKIDNLS